MRSHQLAFLQGLNNFLLVTRFWLHMIRENKKTVLRTIRLSKRLDELPQKDAEQHWNEHSDEMIRMTQAGVIVADHNAIVVEMLANNADPLAAQVYAAIGLSHFESTRDLYSTMTRKSTVSG